ncbi:hypothetical protein AHF37_00624 [Paragonimus kellicotti]|nr:hypothetical protein AHF37_00624 [Paragonimus kellicotti]
MRPWVLSVQCCIRKPPTLYPDVSTIAESPLSYSQSNSLPETIKQLFTGWQSCDPILIILPLFYFTLATTLTL